MASSGRPPREIDADDKQRWEELRGTARDRIRDVHQEAGNLPLLDQLAWLIGARADKDQIKTTVKQCITERYHWKEISEAAGYGQSPPDVRRFKAHYS